MIFQWDWPVNSEAQLKEFQLEFIIKVSELGQEIWEIHL